MSEGLFKHLARPAKRPRILRGDFEKPQAGRSDGIVITFGQVIGDDGQVTARRLRQGGSGERWDAAERSILTGLEAQDPAELLRRLHGYGVADYSCVGSVTASSPIGGSLTRSRLQR